MNSDIKNIVICETRNLLRESLLKEKKFEFSLRRKEDNFDFSNNIDDSLIENVSKSLESIHCRISAEYKNFIFENMHLMKNKLKDLRENSKKDIVADMNYLILSEVIEIFNEHMKSINLVENDIKNIFDNELSIDDSMLSLKEIFNKKIDFNDESDMDFAKSIINIIENCEFNSRLYI